jgi:hypothetical protein
MQRPLRGQNQERVCTDTLLEQVSSAPRRRLAASGRPERKTLASSGGGLIFFVGHWALPAPRLAEGRFVNGQRKI